MSKKALWLQTIIFLCFIGIFFILNLIIPDRDFSQNENRVLQTLPKFSFEDLFEGKFTADFEDYVTDQFAFRDSWTALKARCELALGKDENKGIFLCEGERLIEAFDEADMDDFDFKLSSIDALAKNNSIPVYFALVPSAAEIYSDMLPTGAPNCSQLALIEYAYSSVSAANVDIYSALATHRDENIFYRTDHHWTTLGAYYGYTAIAEAMGFEPVDITSYTEEVVSTEFLGTTFSASGFAWVKPESISRYVPQGDMVITNYPSGSPVEGTMYDESFLTAKDKYSYFYGGNTPLLKIETGKEGLPSLLIVRDSYMDSLSPYLTEHFSTIHIVDLRYNNASLKAYIAQNNIDNILVCYSVPNFSTDGNIFLIEY